MVNRVDRNIDFVVDDYGNLVGYQKAKREFVPIVTASTDLTGRIANITAGSASDFYLTKWVDSAKKSRAYALKSIRPVMAAPPTVTTPANLSAIASAVSLTPNSNSAFTFDGVWSDSNFGYWGSNVHSGILTAASTKSSRLEFMTDSPLWGINYGTNGNTAKISIWINDELTSATPISQGQDANPHYVLVDSTALASPNGPWKVRIDTTNQSYFAVVIGPNDSVWQVSYPESIRVGFMGDSITQGYKPDSSTEPVFHRGWWNTCSDLLGWKRAYSLGIDSTGYINTGGTLKFADRLVSAASLKLDVLVTAGGINDFLQTSSALQTSVSAYLAQCASLLPNTKHIVLGSFTAPGQTQPTANFQAIKDAWAAAGVTYIDTKLPTPWQGTNSATYLDADTVHPNTKGHDYIAVRVRDSINAHIDSL